MYIPAQNFSEQQDLEVYCPISGERYVWVDADNSSQLPPHLSPGAIERLPNRFFQQPLVSRHENQIRVHFVPTTPEPTMTEKDDDEELVIAAKAAGGSVVPETIKTPEPEKHD
jgi:hypothetical protein